MLEAVHVAAVMRARAVSLNGRQKHGMPLSSSSHGFRWSSVGRGFGKGIGE